MRIFGYFIPKSYAVLGVVEASVLFLAFVLSAMARLTWASSNDLEDGMLVGAAGIYAVVIALAMVSMGLYQRGAYQQPAGLVVRLGISFSLGAIVLAAIFYLAPALYFGRGVLGLGLIFSFLGILVTRYLFHRIVGETSRKRRLLVLGAGRNAKTIGDLATKDPDASFSVVGYFPLRESQPVILGEKLLDPDLPVLDLARANHVDEIVVAADDRRGKLPIDQLLDCKMSGFEVLDLSGFFERYLAIVKIDFLYPSWIIYSPGFRLGVSWLYGKRLFDLSAGLLMLVATAPIMLLVALLSLIESRGKDPVLYHQLRVGLNGKSFRLHKFRSMRADAEADGVPRWAEENDVRITVLGKVLRKSRLDELPQIFNVIKGEMSLVGPRPERPEFVESLRARIPYYSERHRVKPGITGWAQLLYPYGSGEADAKRKLEFDLYYVKHTGIFLDMLVLLLTVQVVLLGKGAR